MVALLQTNNFKNGFRSNFGQAVSSTLETTFLPNIIKIAKIAGKIILGYKNSDNLHTTQKHDKSYVTQADHDANHFIAAHLKSLNPNIPVVSEENYEQALKQYAAHWLPQQDASHAKDFLYWAVDPLDGTQSFIKNKKDYACLLYTSDAADE